MPQMLDPRFPSSIQELWATLSADVVWLHGRWIIYRQLFGTSEDRVELLNEAAGTVTWIFQNLLLHDVQLSLSKIGDPAGTGSRQNLTLRRLQVALRTEGETSLADKIEPLLLAFEAACDKVRHRRNKWIAHNDLSTRLNARAAPLTGPSREEMEIALSALREVMNCVELRYTKGQTVYDQFIMNQDGRHLVAALAKAKRYKELVKEGVIARDDFRRRFPDGV